MPPQPLTDKRNITDLIDKLGLEILDEPSGQQSEPALLHMKLRSVSTQPRTTGPPPSVSKSFKDIEKWIAEVQLLNVNQPFPMVLHNRPLQEIDTLMTEWPPEMERALNSLGFPSGSLNCSLTYYIELICSLLDISISAKRAQADYILALHTLFNLYLAVKNSVNWNKVRGFCVECRQEFVIFVSVLLRYLVLLFNLWCAADLFVIFLGWKD